MVMRAWYFSLIFQSTSSVWRTTPPSTSSLIATLISIHVLRVEDDCARFPRVEVVKYISIHVLRVEDDLGTANI